MISNGNFLRVKRSLVTEALRLASAGKHTTGSYQRLDLFIKVLRVLCPNLTDDSKIHLMGIEGDVVSCLYEIVLAKAFSNDNSIFCSFF